MLAFHLLGPRWKKYRAGLSLLLSKKIWIGKTTYLPPEMIGRTLPYKEKALFAVAGVVAECCWRRESFDDTQDFWDEPDSMSETDWIGCGCEPGNPTSELLKIIKLAFSLFDCQTGKLWPRLMLEARWLIENSRTSS
jgi:hypothetical protein